jgi:hypothetical protein
MRRWLAASFISVYLGSLSIGIVAHALQWGTSSHPIMYYLVWDMFCGWTAYESRYHVLGEGESGAYYSLAPGPWGYFAPFADIPRNHYDAFGHTLARMSRVTLNNTDHEPMRRILVVEECWSKKFNIPDSLWSWKYDVPKEPHSYFWQRATISPQGELLDFQLDFPNAMASQQVFDNPRLMRDSQRNRPMFAARQPIGGSLSTTD